MCCHSSCLSYEWVQDPPWCERAAQPASCQRRRWSRGIHRLAAETQDALCHNYSLCPQCQGGWDTLRDAWMQHTVEHSVLKLLRGPGWMVIWTFASIMANKCFFFQDVLLQLSAEIRAHSWAKVESVYAYFVSEYLICEIFFSWSSAKNLTLCLFKSVWEKESYISASDNNTRQKVHLGK